MAESSHEHEEAEPIPARLAPESPPPTAADAPLPPRAPQCDDAPRRTPTEADDPRSGGNGLARRALEHRQMVGAEHAEPRQRRVFLPVMLFLVTCLSTFWAGITGFKPELYLPPTSAQISSLVVNHWQDGLIYMVCVLAILFAHEMGHFLMTLRYKIAASLPYFLPVPITPIGTMGAVISMDGLSANRRQMFDIGLAGPLAGLVLAIPITWYGVTQIDLQPKNVSMREAATDHIFHMPVLIQQMVQVKQPGGRTAPLQEIRTHQLNPYLMAGWVGLLITGLNMMPISQLDGGHVIYALFGKRAHIIARAFLFLAIFFVVAYFDRAFIWMPMLVLVTLIGTDHPPTADDRAPLGWFRTALGYASLTIPFLCFPFFGLRPLGL